MQLPATSAAINFLMDPARKYVLFNQFAYPALQVQSVINRATDFAVIQQTGANQPVWKANAVQGTYSYVNNPGVLGSFLPAGIDGLVFSGSQYLSHNSIASASDFATPEAGVTVVSVVNPASSGGTIWSFADATDGYSVSLSYSSGAFHLSETNTHGTFTASATETVANTYVVTAIRAGGALTLRVNSAVVAGPVAVTAGTVVPTTFTVGGLNSSGSVSSEFNGTLGVMAVYTGAADIYQVETFLLQKTGIILGASQGINSGF